MKTPSRTPPDGPAPRQPREHFPPYELADRDVVAWPSAVQDDRGRHARAGAVGAARLFRAGAADRLPGLSGVEAGRLWLDQLVQLLLVAGGLTMRDAFATLGVDQAAMQLYGFELQRDVYRRTGHEEGDSPAATRGLFKMSRAAQDRITRLLFPIATARHRRDGVARLLEPRSRSLAAATAGWPRAPDPPGLLAART